MRNYTRSEQLAERLKKVIPSGAQTYSKSARYYCEGAGPVVLERGKNGHVWDVDGNEFVDFVLGLGAISVGYGIDSIDSKIREQLERGIAFTLANELEILLAEKLVEIIPCAEMVRFVKNGTDATTAAVRLARAYTGRDHVLMAGYHGWQDWSIGTTPNDLGIPEDVKALSHKFIYNDLDSVQALLEKRRGKVAAIILEPANQVVPDSDFLPELRKMATEAGAVLIFDEVVSGFRMSLGGGQSYFGVTPDLACFGKGMANGASVSALVGRKELMGLIDAGAFVSSTHGGEALSLAAALATIQYLERPGVIERVWDLGDRLFKGAAALVEEHALADVIRFSGYACHPGMQFSEKNGLSVPELVSVFQQAMLDNGILCLPVSNFCATHSNADMDAYINALSAALANVAKAVRAGSVDGLVRGKVFNPIFKRT